MQSQTTEQNEARNPKLASFQDILSALKEVPLNFDELQILSQQIDTLYGQQLHLITQNLSGDVWTSILEKASFHKLSLNLLLAQRTVCKSWDKLICSLPNINTRNVKKIDRILELFPRLRYLKLTSLSSNTKLDFPSLTRLNHLRIQCKRPDLSSDLKELAPLTNLTKLTITTDQITSLGPLPTSVVCLSLKRPFKIERTDIESRTHVTRLISDDKAIFFNGPGLFKARPLNATPYHYDGGFVNGEYEGHAVLHFADGDRYEGSYLKGKKDGHGVYYHNTGTVYTGTFRNGQRLYGTIQTVDATITGPFEDNWCTGKATIVYANGNRYEGELKKGRENGEGVLTLPDGTQFSGEFEKGVFVGKTERVENK